MDDRVVNGLQTHFERFRDRLKGGEERLGYKVAFNAPAVQADLGLPFSLVAGMTRSTIQGPEAFSLTDSTKVMLEAEVAAFLKADIPQGASRDQAAAAVSHFSPAIEVVDFDRPLTELQELLSEGVFHRSVAFGDKVPAGEGAELKGIVAHVRYNGAATADVDAGETTGDVPNLMLHLARLLGRFDMTLQAGDVVIMGAMIKPLAPQVGDRFSVQLDDGPRVDVTLGE